MHFHCANDKTRSVHLNSLNSVVTKNIACSYIYGEIRIAATYLAVSCLHYFTSIVLNFHKDLVPKESHTNIV